MEAHENLDDNHAVHSILCVFGSKGALVGGLELKLRSAYRMQYGGDPNQQNNSKEVQEENENNKRGKRKPRWKFQISVDGHICFLLRFPHALININ